MLSKEAGSRARVRLSSGNYLHKLRVCNSFFGFLELFDGYFTFG